MIAIRGATSVDKNEKEEIMKKSIELFEQIQKNNYINSITSIIVSVTKDITAYNPATAIRYEENLINTPLMCVQEAEMDNSPKGIIRVLIHCDSATQKHVYLHKAKDLRPDMEDFNV